MDVANHQSVALEVLEPRREHLVPGPLSRGRDLAEPEGARLQDVEDEGGPGPPKDFDGLLERLALRVDALLHVFKYGAKAIQRKVA